MDAWLLMPDDVLVVLHGYPPDGMKGSPRVDASYRPDLNEYELGQAGRWAMEHGRAYCFRRGGGDHAGVREWQWHNLSAMHLLVGRRLEINIHGT